MTQSPRHPSTQPKRPPGSSPNRRQCLLGAALLGVAKTPFAQAARHSSAGGGTAPLPVIGQPYPLPEELTLLDDSTLRPVHSHGTVLVLYWWASWCPFCAIQSPTMDKLWRSRRSGGLQMLGLSIDKKRDDAIAYLRTRGYAFPSTFVTPEIEKIMARPKGLPITVVLGRDGKVKMAEAGQLFLEDVEEIARFP